MAVPVLTALRSGNHPAMVDENPFAPPASETKATRVAVTTRDPRFQGRRYVVRMVNTIWDHWRADVFDGEGSLCLTVRARTWMTRPKLAVHAIDSEGNAELALMLDGALFDQRYEILADDGGWIASVVRNHKHVWAPLDWVLLGQDGRRFAFGVRDQARWPHGWQAGRLLYEMPDGSQRLGARFSRRAGFLRRPILTVDVPEDAARDFDGRVVVAFAVAAVMQR